MIVVRSEWKAQLPHWAEAQEIIKRVMASGAWKCKEYRVYTPHYSGGIGVIAVEMLYDNIEDWIAAEKGSTERHDQNDLTRWFEIISDGHWSYWRVQNQD